MCEANVYLLRRGGGEELVMEELQVLIPQGEEVYLRSILGEERRLRARLKEAHLVEHRVLLEELP